MGSFAGLLIKAVQTLSEADLSARGPLGWHLAALCGAGKNFSGRTTAKRESERKKEKRVRKRRREFRRNRRRELFGEPQSVSCLCQICDSYESFPKETNKHI